MNNKSLNAVEFKIGDFVWLTKDIFDDGGDCHPAGYVGRKGDYMKVTGGSYNPRMIHVVHFDYHGEGGICVFPNEISKETPLLTIAERRQYVEEYGLKRSGLNEIDLHRIAVKVQEQSHD